MRTPKTRAAQAASGRNFWTRIVAWDEDYILPEFDEAFLRVDTHTEKSY